MAGGPPKILLSTWAIGEGEREAGKTVDCRADKVGQCEFIMMMLCKGKKTGGVYKTEDMGI